MTMVDSAGEQLVSCATAVAALDVLIQLKPVQQTRMQARAAKRAAGGRSRGMIGGAAAMPRQLAP